jgi:hypothetical protein
VSDPLARLKSKLEEIQDLEVLTGLLAWDQRTVMPPAGSTIRGRHMGLLQRLSHEKLTDPEVGRLLDEIPLDSLDPDSDEAGLLRLARRLHEKAVQVPSALAAEMAQAAAEAAPVWIEAKATSDFARFLPALERNVELRRRYVACFEPRDEPYDVLLDDYEPEMRTADVRAVFDEIKPVLISLVAEQREREVDDGFLSGDFDLERSSCSACARARGGSTRPSTRSSRAPASTTSGSRRATTRTTSTRSSRRCTSTGTRCTTTSCPPASPTSRSAAAPPTGCTSRRAGSGRTSSAGACRSGASTTRACRSSSPSSSAASSSTASTRA